MEPQATLEDLKRIFTQFSSLKHPKNSYDKSHVNLTIKMLDTHIPLDKVYVDDSPVHGKGVFAKVKINKGELITIYPAHYVILKSNGDGPGKIGVINSDLADRKSIILTNEVRRCYSFSVDKYYDICGHPSIIDNPTFLGHMINDGARGHCNKSNYNLLDEKLYYKVSISLSNADFEDVGGLCVAIVATKMIDINEEILLTYTYKYWMSINNH